MMLFVVLALLGTSPCFGNYIANEYFSSTDSTCGTPLLYQATVTGAQSTCFQQQGQYYYISCSGTSPFSYYNCTASGCATCAATPQFTQAPTCTRAGAGYSYFMQACLTSLPASTLTEPTFGLYFDSACTVSVGGAGGTLNVCVPPASNNDVYKLVSLNGSIIDVNFYTNPGCTIVAPQPPAAGLIADGACHVAPAFIGTGYYKASLASPPPPPATTGSSSANGLVASLVGSSLLVVFSLLL